MYEISACGHFDAAHFLRGYPGKCANIHGHRWKVEVSLAGDRLDETGILIDFMDVKSVLKEVLDIFDHKLINDVPPFDRINPTAENMARFVFDEMTARLGGRMGEGMRIARVSVWESAHARASYGG